METLICLLAFTFDAEVFQNKNALNNSLNESIACLIKHQVKYLLLTISNLKLLIIYKFKLIRNT